MNITLREALAKLDTRVVKSEDPNLWEFAAALNRNYGGLAWDPEFDKRMRAYPIRVWMCTDTMVGIYVYFLDGELVAVSCQSARKSSKTYRFVSDEAWTKIHNLLRSLDKDSADEIHALDEALPNYAPNPGSPHYFSIV